MGNWAARGCSVVGLMLVKVPEDLLGRHSPAIRTGSILIWGFSQTRRFSVKYPWLREIWQRAAEWRAGGRRQLRVGFAKLVAGGRGGCLSVLVAAPRKAT